MRTLVVGGAGFIGSHLCDALLAAGHEIVVADNLSHGVAENVPDGADLARVDITTPEIEQLVAEFAPETIFHLAAPSVGASSVIDPVVDADVTVLGTVRLLAAAARAQTKTFILASTASGLYGEQEERVADETHPARPVRPYGISKLSAELYLGYYARVAGLRSVALRLAHVYGPRQKSSGDSAVIARFCECIKSGTPFTVMGDGKQTRDFLYVSDAVRALMLALGTTTARGVYNIGTGMEIELNGVVQELCRIAGKHPGARYEKARANDIKRSVLNYNHAFEELGYKPSVAIAEGLAKTWAWYVA